MYTFADRSDRSLTLRPEATAPICRAYVEHGFHREPQPAKLFTIASMYRYGAPGRGRHREHWQASVEAIGSDDPSVDAELIQLYDALLRRLGVTQYHLELNSIGCRECRPAYLEALRSWLEANARAPRRGDAREGSDEPAARLRQLRGEAGAGSRRARRGAEDRRVALRRVRRALRRRPRATSTQRASSTDSCRRSSAGSTTTRARPGSSSGRCENENATLSGGGRYDYLVEEIGGPPTPGVGFGAGIERLLLALEAEGVADAEPPSIDVFFAARRGRAARARRSVARRASPTSGSRATPTTRAARSRAS